MFLLCFVFLQRTAQNCPKVRVARPARFFLAQPIKFLACRIVVTVVDAKAPNDDGNESARKIDIIG